MTTDTVVLEALDRVGVKMSDRKRVAFLKEIAPFLKALSDHEADMRAALQDWEDRYRELERQHRDCIKGADLAEALREPPDSNPAYLVNRARGLLHAINRKGS